MAEPTGHPQPCPRCAVLERRVVELERQSAVALARVAGLGGHGRGSVSWRGSSINAPVPQSDKPHRSPKGHRRRLPKNPDASRGRTTEPRRFARFPRDGPTKSLTYPCADDVRVAVGGLARRTSPGSFRSRFPADRFCGGSICTSGNAPVAVNACSLDTSFRPPTPWARLQRRSARTPRL